MQSLRPVQRVNLSTQVMESVKDYIIANNLPAGARLPAERDLASILNCSRTAIREALKSLAAIGVIDVVPGRGAFVAEVDWADVIGKFIPVMARSRESLRYMTETRIAIETTAINSVIGRATEEDLARLQKAADRLSEAKSAEERVELDSRFHEALADIAGNPLLIGFGRFLREFFRATHSGEPKGPADSTIEEHNLLIKAIKDKDRAQAEALISRHLEKYLE